MRILMEWLVTVGWLKLSASGKIKLSAEMKMVKIKKLKNCILVQLKKRGWSS